MNHLFSFSNYFLTGLLITLVSFASVSQKDFNNYQTVLSRGKMPADFSTSVQQKVLDDIAQNKIQLTTKLETQEYLETIHGKLNKMLYSGRVIYGDEISEYVTNLAKQVLKDEPELAAELRFYTIKSNETNAFSTAPGIIFVTTGLISQLSSEAQLAFILAHEIAHYQQKHTYKEYLNYKKTGKIKREEQVIGLSDFSKENELEADSLALVRYYKMGYSKEELIGTFDLLMYSYLPFDEIAFPLNYFNTPDFYIPKKEIDLEIKPITAEEDYNDALSSHPNIKKRKDAIEKTAVNYTNWGNTSFLSDQDDFNYIRTICRFESVRTSVMEGRQFSSLYAIFLLEREFPASRYLDQMKALSWLSNVRLKADFEKGRQKSEIEGESSLLYKFLSNYKNKDRSVMGLRIIYDLKAKYPDDPFFEKTYDIYLRELNRNDIFKLSDYQPLNFQQASAKALIKEPEPVAKEDTTSFDQGSKYSRIKEKRALQQIPVFDSTDFFTYAIADILADSVFLKKFKTYEEQADSLDEKTHQLEFAKVNDRAKLEKEAIEYASKQEASFRDILLVDPGIYGYYKKPKPEWEILANTRIFLNTVLKTAKDQGFNPFIISEDSILNQSTEAFNEYLTYLAFVEQVVEANKLKECLPIDYDLLSRFADQRGTSVLLFTSTNHSYAPELSIYSLALNTRTGKCFKYELKNIQKSGIAANYGPRYTDLFKLMRQF